MNTIRTVVNKVLGRFVIDMLISVALVFYEIQFLDEQLRVPGVLHRKDQAPIGEHPDPMGVMVPVGVRQNEHAADVIQQPPAADLTAIGEEHPKAPIGTEHHDPAPIAVLDARTLRLGDRIHRRPHPGLHFRKRRAVVQRPRPDKGLGRARLRHRKVNGKNPCKQYQQSVALCSHICNFFNIFIQCS